MSSLCPNYTHTILNNNFSPQTNQPLKKFKEKKNLPSIRSQCPVRTQIQTIETESVKLNSSAAVKRPQNPNEMRLPSVQGRIIYWHIGRSRNANATVAITVRKFDFFII